MKNFVRISESDSYWRTREYNDIGGHFRFKPELVIGKKNLRSIVSRTKKMTTIVLGFRYHALIFGNDGSAKFWCFLQIAEISQSDAVAINQDGSTAFRELDSSKKITIVV